ncbi:MAG TPA: hypothetical protein DCW90_08745 [Lachnospiraceae bacterium]|nr:hypothetical protein [Lachnospiraceae bacterium]
MKFELREGTFEVMQKRAMRVVKDLYTNARNERYSISFECMSQDYADDHFVQNLRSRSLNHNNITLTIEDRGYNRFYYTNMAKRSNKNKLKTFSLKEKSR